MKPASDVRPSAIVRSITATMSSGGIVSAWSTHTTGAAAATTPALICLDRPRGACITFQPDASASTTLPSVLPPSITIISAGAGSSVPNTRISRGRTAASSSTGMTIVTPLTR